MNKFIANRVANFDSSGIRLAFELAQEIPNAIDLSIGFPEDDTPKAIKKAGIAAIKQNKTRYTPANGIEELRQALAAKLTRENDIATTVDGVTITPGITTGILLAYLATLNEGDEVILPDPYFPPYKDLALMIGAKPVLVDTAPSFQLTADMIRPLITKDTKLLVINSPNNPSGAVYPRAELEKIASLAQEEDILIISDEVYEYFAYDTPHFSIGSVYKNTLTLNGFSKSYAMTGWRVGYISGPRDIIDAINELQQYVVFSSSSIAQYASLSALSLNTGRIARKYQQKRDFAKRILSEQFEAIQGGQGAFYLFLKLPDHVGDMAFVKTATHKGVITLPGSAFSKHKDYIRISFAAETHNLEKGLHLVSQTAAEMFKIHSN